MYSCGQQKCLNYSLVGSHSSNVENHCFKAQCRSQERHISSQIIKRALHTWKVPVTLWWPSPLWMSQSILMAPNVICLIRAEVKSVVSSWELQECEKHNFLFHWNSAKCTTFYRSRKTFLIPGSLRVTRSFYISKVKRILWQKRKLIKKMLVKYRQNCLQGSILSTIFTLLLHQFMPLFWYNYV